MGLPHPGALPCECNWGDWNGVTPSSWGDRNPVTPSNYVALQRWLRRPKWGCPIQLRHLAIMRQYKVLQLGLQLGFLVTMDTCNLWYLYSLECFRTSCNNCSGDPMLYTISYIWCNPHAIICKGGSMVKYANEGYFFFWWKMSIN